MNNITYEQFEFWCKHMNMSIEEGYKAMAFTSLIINQNMTNRHDHARKILNDGSHTDQFKKLIETLNNEAIALKISYDNLETSVYNMIDDHDKNNKEVEE